MICNIGMRSKQLSGLPILLQRCRSIKVEQISHVFDKSAQNPIFGRRHACINYETSMGFSAEQGEEHTGMNVMSAPPSKVPEHAIRLPDTHWQQDYIVSSAQLEWEMGEANSGCYHLPPGLWLLAVTRGSFSIETNGETNIIQTPDCFMLALRQEQFINFTTPKDSVVQTIGAYFNWQWVENLIKRFPRLAKNGTESSTFFKQDNLLMRNPSNRERLFSALQDLSDFSIQTEVDPIWRDAKAQECICYIFDDYLALSSGTSQPQLTQLDQTILTRAQTHMQNNLASSLTSPAIASAIGVNYRRLNQLFKQAHSKSVSQYVRDLRMRTAFETIYENGENVATAAFKVGLSPNYLSSAFKDYFGVHPSKITKS